MPPLTFLNSLFLAGLAAAALPILIHLFSKRKAKEVRFPSLEFLQEVSRKKVRRLQLRQILLLALRVLIIAFFAMAMGRPAVRTGTVVGRGSSTVAIVLDDSFSMAARDPGVEEPPAGGAVSSGAAASVAPIEGTVFERARERALDLVGLMNEGDRGIVVFGASPVRMPYQTPVTDLSLLRQEIDRAGITATRADLPQAVEKAMAALNESRTLNRELYVISDFQRIDVEAWQALLGRRSDSLRAAGEEESAARVYLIPARTEAMENLAIERVRLEALGAGAEASARLVVSVANFAPTEARDAVLRAVADGGSGGGGGGEALGEGYVTVPAMGRADATVLLRRLPTSGAVRVVLTPDALPLDNTAYLVTEQPGVRRVLIVSGSGEPESDRAVRHLQLALDPEGTREFFEVRVARADDPSLGGADGLRADVVVLLDVPRLPDGTLEQITRFRADGGGVLVVMGDRVDARTYNAAIFPRLASVELLGLQGDPNRPEVYRSLRVAATGHPIFEGFPAAGGAAITQARFRRLIEARVGAEARVLAEFSGGIPAIVEDRGTIVFATGLDGVWNDLPTSGAFVPLVHRMIQHLAAQGGGADRVLAGSVIERAFGADEVGPGGAWFVDPVGERAAAERSEREGKVWLRSGATRLPGVYELVRDDGVRLGLYGVNLDARESDLGVAPAGALPGLFKPEAKVLKADGDLTRQLAEGRFGRELWPLLLMVVLGLLVVEGLLGRGRMLS